MSRFYQYANNFPFPAKTKKFNTVVPFKRKSTPDKVSSSLVLHSAVIAVNIVLGIVRYCVNVCVSVSVCVYGAVVLTAGSGVCVGEFTSMQ